MLFYNKKNLVGKDEFGNCYYEVIKRGKKHRYIRFNGIVEASKVSPAWYMWLHYATEGPIKKAAERMPNATGTKQAFFPHEHYACDNSDYEPWQPQ